MTIAEDGNSAQDTLPSRMPRAERRIQLLDAARSVFAARGFHAASMDDIADRAGVSKPVLYQHFPGKVELYLALLDAEAALLLDSLKTALRSTTDNRQRVGAAIGAYFSLADGETGHRLLFEPEMSADRTVRQRVEAMEDECARLIAEVIVEDTAVHPGEAHLLAAGMCGMAIVGASSWLRAGRPVPLEAAVADVARLAWKGISGFPRVN
jgi:AcrR family transcriptional regulator